MSIPTEAIEKVAVAIWEATGHRPSDWIYMAPEIPRKQRYMSYATAALTAAAPAIQAAALRDAAESFQGVMIGFGGRDPRTSGSAWLHARADQLEGKSE